jgi:ACS family D-galactonate transporter-like MFS transporter
MTATFQTAGAEPTISPINRLWQRQLNHFPSNRTRALSLGIVIATTVVLYYQLYLSGGVAVQILGNLHMSFLYFVNISVIGYAFGAIASVVAGLADRYGRANIVTVGLGVTGVLSVAVLPHVHTEMSFAITYIAIGFVEGIVLVATPALIRDFSPQLGRASAMGGWTLGPVLGSLVVALVVTNTSSHTWQWQYGLAGIIGLVVFAIAAVGLRELAPNLRDQLMVSQKDRVLIEARAKGLDIESTLKKPFRQMLHFDIIGSAFAISVFLTIYYLAVGFFPTFFETVFGYSASKANGLGDYFWAIDAAALLIVGIVSDLVRVRKPFMILGAVGAIVFTSLFAITATHKSTTHGYFVVLLVGIAVFLGIAFAPWMASFTETVERRNPALTATGLAVWGLTIRVVIALIVVFVPHVVTTVSTLVDKGPTVQADAAKYAPELATAAKVNPAVLATLSADPTNPTAGAEAVSQISGVPVADVAGIAMNAATLQAAAKIDSTTATTLATDPTNQAAQLTALSEVSGVSLADTTTVATLQATEPAALAAGAALDPATAATLLTDPTNAAAGAKAVGEVVAALKVTPAAATADLQQLGKIPTSELLVVQANAAKLTAGTATLKQLATIPTATLVRYGTEAPKVVAATAQLTALAKVPTSVTAYLTKNAPSVEKAAKDSPKQWQKYFWVGVGGQVIFIPLVFLMAGYWSPRKARKAEMEHEAMVAAEMAKLQQA